jgi:hypothetical protein
MCFSPTISFAFFTAGAILTYLSYTNHATRGTYMYVLFAFYTLMELLQTLQYSVVNDCTSLLNILSTELAYVLITVQPLLWNTIFYFRSKDEKHKSIFKLAIVLCIIWIIMNVYARVSYNPKYANDQCGLFNFNKTCTLRKTNTSHLYWRWKTNHYPDITANYFMYLCLWIVPALLVPNSRNSGIVILIGALFGCIITIFNGGSLIEFPAIWCYISVPLLVLGYVNVVMQKPLF